MTVRSRQWNAWEQFLRKDHDLAVVQREAQFANSCDKAF